MSIHLHAGQFGGLALGEEEMTQRLGLRSRHELIEPRSFERQSVLQRQSDRGLHTLDTDTLSHCVTGLRADSSQSGGKLRRLSVSHRFPTQHRMLSESRQLAPGEVNGRRKKIIVNASVHESQRQCLGAQDRLAALNQV
ncbi:hypothetical protein D3C72_1241790 [compost metagenome]